MAQITHGIRSVLSRPSVYAFFQNFMGAHDVRKQFVAEFVRPLPSMSVLDIGCGTADIVDHLPQVDYWGFDVSQAYISAAKERFGQRGRFFCEEITATDLPGMPAFDIVLVMGVLHHLDDETARRVIQLAHDALGPNGRLVTFDPCVAPGQNSLARWLVLGDRGRNVRDSSGYARLAETMFAQRRIEVRHRRWIPYTHCFMECTRT